MHHVMAMYASPGTVFQAQSAVAPLYCQHAVYVSDCLEWILTAGLRYYPLLGHGQRFPVNDPDLLPNMSPRPGQPVHS